MDTMQAIIHYIVRRRIQRVMSSQSLRDLHMSFLDDNFWKSFDLTSTIPEMGSAFEIHASISENS
uniref:Uncharacterized protein n=1 Tax=Pristionchus pacificus TaxID=54126 RepID=A0A2A6C0M2_PRIPA|eukprot:PDM71715.1 hypothetical protein PRIPAC_38122 [Pristionchus pacificus]